MTTSSVRPGRTGNSRRLAAMTGSVMIPDRTLWMMAGRSHTGAAERLDSPRDDPVAR
ncbi:hypothetical protein AB0878_20655 [Amycolatopsis sp. NPDC047767]|uniref:hypothetical protein n=1 Tax=Amycolatopsis sp. NPDC047767 TaxID=3156765 RepID=UPI003455D6F6